MGPANRWVNAISALTSVQFNSTYQLYQHNYFCTAGADQLNYPGNESAFYPNTITGNPEDNSALTNFTTYGYQRGRDRALGLRKGPVYLSGTYNRSPYLTSVGLYSDSNELLAIAKLNQPIKKPFHYPLTVRIVLDMQ
jgi:hypothetical protein